MSRVTKSHVTLKRGLRDGAAMRLDRANRIVHAFATSTYAPNGEVTTSKVDESVRKDIEAMLLDPRGEYTTRGKRATLVLEAVFIMYALRTSEHAQAYFQRYVQFS